MSWIRKLLLQWMCVVGAHALGMALMISQQAQGQVDHWEAVVQDGSTWNYLIPDVSTCGVISSVNFADDAWDRDFRGLDMATGMTPLSCQPRQAFTCDTHVLRERLKCVFKELFLLWITTMRSSPT